ncbi:MAG: Bax inhibitor-1/YccA family protein [Ruminococcus sp.]
MNIIQQQNSENKNAVFAANPVVRQLNKVEERAKKGEGATYAGITVKTVFFLLMTVVGVAGYYLTHLYYFSTLEQLNLISDDGLVVTYTANELIFVGIALLITLIFPFLAVFLKKTIPVTGTIYSMSQGFLLGWIIHRCLQGFEHLALEALVITLIIVAVMAILYATRIVKVTGKFRVVMTTLFATVILSSIAGFILYFIPATSGFVSEFFDNPLFSIGFSVLGIITATLFLLTDFDTIEKTVENNLPKKYEWSAAFGLAFTVIWIYLKVLDLLLTLSKNNK